jgi:hypothetical protein
MPKMESETHLCISLPRVSVTAVGVVMDESNGCRGRDSRVDLHISVSFERALAQMV